MGDEQKIVFRRIGWNRATDHHLSLIGGLVPADLEFYKAAISDGRKGLMGVFEGGAVIGSIIWSIADEPKGRVIVIDEMGAECRAGRNLITATEKMAAIFGPQMGAKYFRFLTKRRGLLRQMETRFEITYLLEKSL